MFHWYQFCQIIIFLLILLMISFAFGILCNAQFGYELSHLFIFFVCLCRSRIVTKYFTFGFNLTVHYFGSHRIQILFLSLFIAHAVEFFSRLFFSFIRRRIYFSAKQFKWFNQTTKPNIFVCVILNWIIIKPHNCAHNIKKDVCNNNDICFFLYILQVFHQRRYVMSVFM